MGERKERLVCVKRRRREEYANIPVILCDEVKLRSAITWNLSHVSPYTDTAMASSSNQPNTTLYINNLNDKINKEELKIQLFALFTTYGKIIDIIASKSQKMRGQAFLVFTDLAGATSAMRACEGMMFYDKPLVSNQN